ncbi:related to steroid monooxygenase [Fusarium oxysporum]|uniref:Related to steroid monooxygenase n=1 Tax=Fusarium oxysporum TaxID=5507 RepID=A0A2H3TRS6_FUSOX|nr:related to steroid monooxygenase [Fusarium oxysporum]
MATVNQSQASYVIEEHPLNEPRPIRIIVVGAGAAGINFAYATQKYLRNHKVTSTAWSEEDGTWTVDVQDEATGEVFKDRGEFLINASGFLNNWKWPDIPGLKTFEGQLVHTANWKEDISLQGKTVAIIGNGSTAIQLLPEIQSDSKEQKEEFKNDPIKFSKYRKAIEEEISATFGLVLKDSDAQAQAKALLTEYMKHKLGKDSPLADRLVPDFGVLCRRASPGIGYLEALNEDNVRVVLDPIDSVVKDGIRVKTGETILFDVLICATGFDLSWKPRFPILGLHGSNLQTQYDVRPFGYLGICAPKMPNYFVYFGPNSPLAHGSALPSFEHITTYMIRMIYKAQTEGYHSFEPSAQATSEFLEHCDAFFPRTIWSTKCRSWFKGGKEDGPVYALHPGSRAHWFHMMNEPRYEDYIWKSTNRNRFAYLGNGFSLREVEGQDITWFLDKPDTGYKSVFY